MKIIKNCKYCAQKFETTSFKINVGKGKFCSKKCYTDYLKRNGKIISETINYYCIVCNKGMHLTNYLKRMNIKCCSQKCQHESQKKRVKIICSFCKQEFESTPSGNSKFCSNICKNNSYRRSLECEQCHKKFITCNRKRNPNHNHYFCSNKCKFIWSKGNPHPKMSEWLAINISSGTFIPIAQDYKQGYIINISTGKYEFYASSYEKLRMEQLNEQNVSWTKKHKIKIKYIDKNGIFRYYIPDFLINNVVVEEIKPSRMLNEDNNPLKFEAGKEYCKNNNLEFKIITEKELGIKI